MTLLLPDDQSEVVTQMASGISERMAMEKIVAWINKHVTIGTFYIDMA